MNAERGDMERADEDSDFYEFDAETAASVARAEEDIRAGRVVSNEVVIEWLKTWGKPGSGPCPREWLK